MGLRLIREDPAPIPVEIDREDDGTAAGKLRDEVLLGHPALWIRWHGAQRAELPAGVARLHLPARRPAPPSRTRCDELLTLRGEHPMVSEAIDRLERDMKELPDFSVLLELLVLPHP
ncbi:hypothetical protein SSAG_00247 [Streptomyces sp. Mg1]|nr:hypothetical protein SSAG_00247 [Streptomyces sp. Mg1]